MLALSAITFAASRSKSPAQPKRALGGAGDLRLQLAQLGGGETHLAGERLTVNKDAVERRRHQPFAVLRGDLDEIAKHIVVLDLENADARFFDVTRLQCGDDAPDFVAQRARLVE